MVPSPTGSTIASVTRLRSGSVIARIATGFGTASDVAGLTTGALFFQHLIGTTADVAITPSPIEDEDNNMLEMNCWMNPDGFYDELQAEYGHFSLHNYWGPMANIESSD